MSTEKVNGQYIPKIDLIVPADIGIVGYGVVGQALAHGFDVTSNHSDRIRYFDKYKKSLPLGEVIDKSEIIFVCLPTPIRDDEEGYDQSILEENISEIAKFAAGSDKIITIKSTVEPGTTSIYEKEYPDVVFASNPEFLTEAHPVEDFLKPDRTIIGAHIDATRLRLSNLYEHRLDNPQVRLTDPTTAEMAKLAANVMLAMRVVVCNMFFDMSSKLYISYEEMIQLVGDDHRIGHDYLQVTTLRGFGGKCLPKEVRAYIAMGRRYGLDVSPLAAAWEYNLRIRKEHDWKGIPGAVQGNINFSYS